MPLSVLILPFLAAAAAAEPPITVTGRPWAPFISPMGEPFRSRAAGDDTLARWFYQADRNRDGALTPDEMQADADRFFARLDDNHDGMIDPEEVIAYEWDLAPEIQVNTKWKRARGQAVAEARPREEQDDAGSPPRRPRREDEPYQIHGLQGAARYSLLNIPEPVAGADADFDRAITLGEFRQAATYRFALLDRNRQGRLTLPELVALVPTPPKPGKKAKPPKDGIDPRVGLPLPRLTSGPSNSSRLQESGR